MSCSSSEDKGELLAKVYDKELYQADLDYLFRNHNYNTKDSIELVEQYRDQWVEEQILVHEAENSADIDMDAIDKKAEHYKNNLLIHQLESSLLEERLDTNVQKEEIRAYYKENQQDFKLNDYLVKVLYMKIPFDAPDIEKVAKWYMLKKETDIEEIDIYSKIYASNYYYDDENWIYFDDLLKEIPLQDIKKDRFIMNRSKIRFEESGYYYFLNIIDYKLKNTLSPLDFEEKNIKERILNMRVKSLREEIKNELLQKAHEEGNVEVF
ncbi:MAG: hypothetical protein MI810_22630 [Flavobacteriales bacterium]|nr:hypothetical protein [Flavobacteriales bacterium]